MGVLRHYPQEVSVLVSTLCVHQLIVLDLNLASLVLLKQDSGLTSKSNSLHKTVSELS